MSRPPHYPRRQGAAAVELAAVLPLLLVMLIGVWELGRVIHVQQVMVTAARDGARLAAQGWTINTTGEHTKIRFAGGNPNVEDAIRDSLLGAGITNLDGVQISFRFLEGDTGRGDPYLGAKNERFRIRVALPYDNVRWTNLSLFAPDTLSVEVNWQMLVDDPFTLNTALPGWNPPH